MSKFDKLLKQLLSGNTDSNMAFTDIVKLLEVLGFSSRIKGSHHIFYKKDIDEIINIQPFGNKAKSYQVKQVRNLIIKYKLALDNDT